MRNAVAIPDPPDTIRGLLIPLALRPDGAFVRPSQVKDEIVFCPLCGSDLLVRGGPGTRVRRHFYHRQEECTDDPETMAHATAKLLLARHLELSKKFWGGVFVRRRCPSCKRTGKSKISPRFDTVEVEHQLPNGRVVDVATLRDGRVLAAFEIVVTHEIDKRKARALSSVPWIELDAFEVLCSPNLLRPFRRPERRLCKTCDERLDRWRNYRDQVASRTGQMIPSSTSPYVA